MLIPLLVPSVPSEYSVFYRLNSKYNSIEYNSCPEKDTSLPVGTLSPFSVKKQKHCMKNSCILLSRNKVVLLCQECAQGCKEAENLKLWTVLVI